MKDTIYNFGYKIRWKYNMYKTKYFYKLFFGSIGKKCTICKPMRIVNPRNMYLGNHVRIREGARIETIVNYNGELFSPNLVIEDNVGFEQGLHLTCGESVKIGKDTTVSAYVYITDCTHDYLDLKTNVLNQKLSTHAVEIGECSFIGLGSCIMPGTILGKHCVVGTRAVVNGGTYKDYSVLVGAPAKCVKRYDVENGEWKRTSPNGEFI